MYTNHFFNQSVANHCFQIVDRCFFKCFPFFFANGVSFLSKNMRVEMSYYGHLRMQLGQEAVCSVIGLPGTVKQTVQHTA